MPQIDQLSESWYFASQLFWLVLVFGAIFIVIGLGMLPKVEATVDSRDRHIAGDLAAARQARDAADTIEADWRDRANAARAEAAAVVAAAKARAATDSANRLAEVNAAIESQLSAAEVAITAARQSAMAEVEGVAADVTQGIVSRLTGAKISPAQAAAAVKARLHG